MTMQAIHAGSVSNSFIVNSYLPGNQYFVNLAAASANGDKILLWSDVNRSASFIQRYDVKGSPLSSGEVYVGGVVGAVAADRVGNYAIVSQASDGSGDGVFVTLYDRAGNVRGNTFRVNDSTLDDQRGGTIAMSGNGNFSVGYMSWENGQWNTYVKQYYANGVARGPALKLNAPGTVLNGPYLTIDSAGNTIATGSYNVGGNNLDIWMRRISPSNALLGGQITVNTYTAGLQSGGNSAVDSSNNVIVVWDSYGQDGNGWSIYGQRFNPDGSRYGSPFLINQNLLASEQPTATVGIMDDGSFAVSWYVDNRSNDPTSIPTVYSRQFRSDLTPVGPEFVVSTIPNGKAFFPRMAMDLAGNYIIAWRNYNPAGDFDVAARRYVMDTLPPITLLNNGQSTTNFNGATGSWKYFKINIPTGTRTMNLNMTGLASGDGDLYVRFGALPTLAKWDVRPYIAGNNESVSISNPPAGDFYIGIYSYSAYSSISLTANFN